MTKNQRINKSIVWIIMALVIISLTGCGKETPKHDVFPIVSLRGEIQAEGSFFLGCGSIDGYEYLMTFRERRDGGLERLQVPMYKVVIYEDSDESPYVEIWDYFWSGSKGTKDRYEFHVPKGTIIKEFKLK